MSADLTRLPATDVARLVRERTVTAAEVTDAALERVGALDGTLHAFVELTADSARAQAAAVDAALARGDGVGPLAGVPLAVKDLIATKGVRNRNGSPAYRDFVPEEDDVVVERVARRRRRAPGQDHRARVRLQRGGAQPRQSHRAQPVEPRR